jgi:hypothetical protein
MEYAIYEDRPRTDIWLKLIFVLPPVLMLIPALFFSRIGTEDTIYLVYGALGTGIVMLALYYFVMPTRYMVCNDKLRIGFRALFAFNIPFDTVAGVRDGRWSTIGINFPANMSQSAVLEIVRKGRMAVTITPSDKKAFIDNFQRAFQDWKQGKDT